MLSAHFHVKHAKIRKIVAHNAWKDITWTETNVRSVLQTANLVKVLQINAPLARKGSF